MSLASILGFTLAMAILAATPGPAFFVLMSRAMANGVKAGAGVLTGVIIADVIFLVLALLGMSAISQAMGEMFVLVKLVGGAYIVFLGYKMWMQKPVDPDEVGQSNGRGYFSSLLEGLVVNLTNPKAIIFFAALLPTFVDVARVTLMDGVILASIVILAGVLVDGSYILLAQKVSRWLRSKKAQRRLNRTGGATLMAVGIAVVTR